TATRRARPSGAGGVGQDSMGPARVRAADDGGPAPGSLPAAAPPGGYRAFGAADPSVEDVGLRRRAGGRDNRAARGAGAGTAPCPRPLGGGRRLLGPPLRDAGAVAAITPWPWRLSPFRALRRPNARGQRVLHPQIDRLGAAGDRQVAAGHGVCLAATARRPSLRGYRPRGREVPFSGAARGGGRRPSVDKAPGRSFRPRTSIKAGNSVSRCASEPSSISSSSSPGENSQIPSTTIPAAAIPLTMVSKRWPNSMVGATSFLLPSVQVIPHSSA